MVFHFFVFWCNWIHWIHRSSPSILDARMQVLAHQARHEQAGHMVSLLTTFETGGEVIWLWINTYENTIFSGMNIHKSQLFWCELQGYKVLTHCHISNWMRLHCCCSYAVPNNSAVLKSTHPTIRKAQLNSCRCRQATIFENTGHLFLWDSFMVIARHSWS